MYPGLLNSGPLFALDAALPFTRAAVTSASLKSR